MALVPCLDIENPAESPNSRAREFIHMHHCMPSTEAQKSYPQRAFRAHAQRRSSKLFWAAHKSLRGGARPSSWIKRLKLNYFVSTNLLFPFTVPLRNNRGPENWKISGVQVVWMLQERYQVYTVQSGLLLTIPHLAGFIFTFAGVFLPFSGWFFFLSFS